MMKSARIYRLHEPVTLSPADWEALLAPKASRPLGGCEPRRMGWSPHGPHKLLAHDLGKNPGDVVLCATKQSRILPDKVLKRHVDEAVDDHEATVGRMVTRGEKLAIKEQVYESLLPRAFVQDDHVFVHYLPAAGVVIVGIASRKRAEEALDLLRETLGSLKVTPWATNRLPMRVMTEWAAGVVPTPADVTIGDKGQLKAKGEDGKISVQHVDITGDECRSALEAGWMVDKCRLNIESIAGVTVTSEFALEGIKFADEVTEEMVTADEPWAADLFLSTDSVIRIVDRLTQSMGGEVTV